MNPIKAGIFNELFKSLCCCQCKNDFDNDSFIQKECYGDVLVGNLKCSMCGKDFGDVVLNINSNTFSHPTLEVVEGPPPINADDVINAHKFIKKNL